MENEAGVWKLWLTEITHKLNLWRDTSIWTLTANLAHSWYRLEQANRGSAYTVI